MQSIPKPSATRQAKTVLSHSLLVHFDVAPPSIMIYKHRWFVLFLYCVLAMVNNAVCFTFAPIANKANDYYRDDIPLDTLVTIYFITYIVFSYSSIKFLERKGLRLSIVLASWLQGIGCVLRCFSLQGEETSSFDMVLFGQFITSLGQGFLVNSPHLLAFEWFDNSEKVTAANIGCLSSFLGVAFVYVFHPVIVQSSSDIPTLVRGMAILTMALALLATVLFPDVPVMPPSIAVQSRWIYREKVKAAIRYLQKHEDLQLEQREKEERARRSGHIDTNALPADEKQQRIHSGYNIVSTVEDHFALTEKEQEKEKEKDSVAKQLNSDEKSDSSSATSSSSSSSFPLSSSSSSSSVATGSPSSSSSSSSVFVSVSVPNARKLSFFDQIELATPPEQALFYNSLLLATENVFTPPEQRQDWRRFLALFRKKGFTITVLSFAAADVCMNGFATFLNYMVVPLGFSMHFVTIVGFLFVIAGMIGSELCRLFLKKTKQYKLTLIVCFACSSVAVFLFCILCHQSNASDYSLLVGILLMWISFWSTPTQLIAHELAMETTHPIGTEVSVFMVHQIMGNVASVIVIPIMMTLRDTSDNSFESPNWVLACFITIFGLVFSVLYNGDYSRLDIERLNANDPKTSLLSRQPTRFYTPFSPSSSNLALSPSPSLPSSGPTSSSASFTTFVPDNNNNSKQQS
eukprot:TRINITY_DN165_c1_g1_i1.p1 TRINITY_DN165_c1_g1~~TRINITY_DN165_c1_g1_i1.p1  ORF type:complete len:688 (-),score=173.64 TRINITY_DN165_c1_g1_i1:276-2339(-)